MFLMLWNDWNFSKTARAAKYSSNSPVREPGVMKLAKRVGNVLKAGDLDGAP